jgi:predicted NBD/HSP70 family sugar kinase
VLAALRSRGELDRAALARLCDLPRSTIADVVARLREQGLVLERPSILSRVGRPAQVVALTGQPDLLGVIALTNDVLRVAAVGWDGTLLASRQRESSIAELTDGLAGPGTTMLTELLTEEGLQPSVLRCAVVCVPLPLAPDGGVPVPRQGTVPATYPRWLRDLPSWLRHDPAAPVSELLGVPAWAENDANLAALGEAHFGAGADAQDLLYLKIVSGVGAGLVLDGRLHRGVGGLAGELAHLHVKEDGPVCLCGGRGCLMTQFSSPRLVDLVQTAHSHPLTLADVLVLAEHGDPGVLRVLTDLGRTIGRSLADLCVYLNPGAVVVDGMLHGAGDAVIAGIRQMLDRYLQPLAASEVRLLRGELAEDAEIKGAVALARARFARARPT